MRIFRSDKENDQNRQEFYGGAERFSTGVLSVFLFFKQALVQLLAKQKAYRNNMQKYVYLDRASYKEKNPQTLINIHLTKKDCKHTVKNVYKIND